MNSVLRRKRKVGPRAAVERPAPRQHLIQDDAERPDVGSVIDREPFRLLGRPCRVEDHGTLMIDGRMNPFR